MAFWDNLSSAQAGVRRGIQGYDEMMQHAASINAMISNDKYRQQMEGVAIPSAPVAKVKPVVAPAPRVPATPVAGVLPPNRMSQNPANTLIPPVAPAPPRPPAGGMDPVGGPTSYQDLRTFRGVTDSYPMPDPDASSAAQLITQGQRDSLITADRQRIGGRINAENGSLRQLDEFLFGTPEGEQAMRDKSEVGAWMMGPEGRAFFQANPELLAMAEKDPVGFYNQYIKSRIPRTAAGVSVPATQPAGAAVIVDSSTGATVPSADAGLVVPGTPAAKPATPVAATKPATLSKDELLQAASIPVDSYPSMLQMHLDDRAAQIDLYNRKAEQIAQIATTAQSQISYLTQKARAAQASGNIAIMDSAMTELNTLIDSTNAATNSANNELEMEAKQYILDSDKETLKIRLGEAAAIFAQRDDTTELNAAWSGLMGSQTAVVPVGDGTYQIGYADQNGEPQWFGGDANPTRMTKEEVLTEFHSIYDEAFRVNVAETRASSAAELQKYQQKLGEIIQQGNVDIAVEQAKAALDDGEVVNVSPMPNGLGTRLTLRDSTVIDVLDEALVEGGVPMARKTVVE